MKVGIVGAGFSGLLSALKIAKYMDVEVFEEHARIGYPRHCTGLVSEYVFNYLGSEVGECTLNSFNRYIVRHVSRPNDEIELRFKERVYLIDRPKAEQYFADVVQSYGGIIYLSHGVKSVDARDTSISLMDGSKKRYDLIILAEGSRANIVRKLGLCREIKYLIGVQAVLRVQNELDHPYVLFGDDLSNEFFGWLVPIDEKNLIAGLADAVEPYNKLKRLISRYLRQFLNASQLSYEITEIFGGLIPMSKPCNQVINKVIGLGDAVSVTKPLSGGGIYGIYRQVRELESLKSLCSPEDLVKEYSSRVKRLLHELRLQHLIKDLINRKFNSINNLILKIIDSRINCIKVVDYDKLVIGPSEILKVLKLITLSVYN